MGPGLSLLATLVSVFKYLIDILGIVVTAGATVVVALFTVKLSNSTKKLWEEAIASGKAATQPSPQSPMQ